MLLYFELWHVPLKINIYMFRLFALQILDVLLLSEVLSPSLYFENVTK